jgi:hypothetical protein
MSPEAFLAWERTQAERHHYVRGEVFAMAGVPHVTATSPRASSPSSARGFVAARATCTRQTGAFASTYAAPGAIMSLDAIGATLAVEELYEGAFDLPGDA